MDAESGQGAEHGVFPFLVNVTLNVTSDLVVNTSQSGMGDTSAGSDDNRMMMVVKAIYLYVIPVVCGLGVAGNILALCVCVLTPFRLLPCTSYLAALTLSDTGFMAALFIAWLTSIRPEVAALAGCCHAMVYVTYVSSFLSVWYVVLMMLERYVVVCYPLRAPLLCTKLRSRLMVGAVTSFGMLLYVHSLFSTHVVVTPHGPRCSARQAYTAFIQVFTYVDSLITFLVPFVAIVVFNVKIILAVRRFRLRHGSGSHRLLRRRQVSVLSQAQVRSAKTLVLVSSAFVTLYLPSHAVRLYILVRSLFDAQAWLDSDTIELAQLICQFPYFINFAVDFVIFFSTSLPFRRNVYRLVKKVAKCK